MNDQDSFTLLLRDVRSFEGLQKVLIRPLTLLVGENSSGKSTVLAALNAVAMGSGFPSQPSFNRAPFSLGGFDSILASSSVRSGRKREFSIGFEYIGSEPKTDDDRFRRDRTSRTVFATYENWHGQPRLSELSIETAEGARVIVRPSYVKDSITNIAGTFVQGEQEFEFSNDAVIPYQILAWADFSHLLHSARLNVPPEKQRLIERIMQTIGYASDRVPFRTVPLSPIRTRPQRSYSEATDVFEPSGEHVPVLLHRLLLDQAGSAEGDELLEALKTYGIESGLLERVKVRQQGPKADDPFQILVVLGSRSRNLVDVGYGVSQSLPLVVETVLAKSRSVLLVQQPEVHLHPRAQAALGSFFARSVANLGKRLVVETHSDYLVDRVRLAIADGTIKRENVSLLFFERKRARTKIHHIDLDSVGNILNPPVGYRDFFLSETMRNLSRGASVNVHNR